MKFKAGFAAVLVAVAFTSGGATAQTWQERVDAGHAAWATGDVQQAADELEAALALAEGFGADDPRLSETLNDLAVAYTRLDRHAEARALLERAIGLRETGDGSALAESLENLATVEFAEGNYAAAGEALERALAAARTGDGSAQRVPEILGQLGTAHYYQGQYAEAAGVYDEALELLQQRLPEDDPAIALALLNRGEIHNVLGEYDEAEPMFTRALEILESNFGPRAPELMAALNNLGALYYFKSDYQQSERMFLRAVEIVEQHEGESLNLAQLLFNLGGIYESLARYSEAETAYRRALHIRETQAGSEHPLVADSLNNLGVLYMSLGRLEKARPLLERALEIHVATFGENHPYVAADMNNLALYYSETGNYSKAQEAYLKVLDLKRRLLGEEHWEVAVVLSNLGNLQQDAGYYDAAERSLREAVAILETALGLEHPTLATGLNNLAAVYEVQGRYERAAALLKRALAINEEAYGPDHAEVASNLNNLGLVTYHLGRLADAHSMLERALAIREKMAGEEAPGLIHPAMNMGAVLERQGDLTGAHVHYRRALELTERTYGPEHPLAGRAATNLAELHVTDREYEKALPLHARALEIHRSAFGDDHPETAKVLSNLGNVYALQGDYEKALDFLRKAVAVYRRLQTRGGDVSFAPTPMSGQTVRKLVSNHVDVAAHIEGKTGDARVRSEAFESAQLLTTAGAVQALNRMVARFASGDDDLARLVRERQDAVERWRGLNTELIFSSSRPPDERDAADEARMRREIDELHARIAGLDVEIAASFPRYSELANPAPLPVRQVAGLLRDGEALLTYFVGTDAVFSWVVTPETGLFRRLDISPGELEQRIGAVRRTLDPAGMAGRRVARYSLQAAYELYAEVVAPVEQALADVTHVLVVPDGPLESLPLAVLVDEPPPSGAETDYRNAAWLMRRYTFTTLPAVNALRALRQFATASSAERPFAGFGNPVLEGDPGEDSVSMGTVITRGSVADVRGVRALPALPETADELRSIARALGGSDAVFVGSMATESRVKRMDLSPYRVLSFATHGLMAGEGRGVSEPALVMTPPREGSPVDDGLLTASEIAQLNLDAEWVILSACNTAASDGASRARGLSGLARAFFYAGSRALLVSHWSVSSDAAVALTTGTVTRMAADPGLGRAEALRRSMLALLGDRDVDRGHPMYWAPFVLVGEAAVTR